MDECTAFLQWCLPNLRLRYEGYRKVRKRACKKIQNRIRELGLIGFDTYRSLLETVPDEWRVLDTACRIHISRFYRDRSTWETIAAEILPALKRECTVKKEPCLRVWSAGCAAGEEPYTLRMIWDTESDVTDQPALEIVATDSDILELERARTGRFYRSELKELPRDLMDRYFRPVDDRGWYELSESIRSAVTFMEQDIRHEFPPGMFHLVLCRNLAFTYFDDALQKKTAERIRHRIVPGGYLLLGSHESVPEAVEGLVLVNSALRLYRVME
jgi:chemotaxis protein methyltransferase CheR